MQRKSILITKFLLALIATSFFMCTSIFMPQILAEMVQVEEESPYFFTNSQVRLEDGLLSVDLKDAPVEKVLLELSRKAVFKLTILGDLKQNITASFEHFSLKKGLRHILGLADVNYAIICERESPSHGQAKCRVNKLVVIAKRELDGAQQVQTATSPMWETKKEILRKKPTTRMHLPSEEQGIEKAEPPERTFEGSLEDLKSYLDKLENSKHISREEYEMIKKRIGRKLSDTTTGDSRIK